MDRQTAITKVSIQHLLYLFASGMLLSLTQGGRLGMWLPEEEHGPQPLGPQFSKPLSFNFPVCKTAKALSRSVCGLLYLFDKQLKFAEESSPPSPSLASIHLLPQRNRVPQSRVDRGSQRVVRENPYEPDVRLTKLLPFQVCK